MKGKKVTCKEMELREIENNCLTVQGSKKDRGSMSCTAVRKKVEL